MSFNGSGTFVINSTGQPVSANTLIEASVFNAFTADVATGLSTCLAKDGQSTVTANLPMGGYKLTGLGDATTANDAVRFNGAAGTPTSLTLTNATGLPAAGVTGTALVAAAIGTTVQAYDVDTAKLDVTQAYSKAQSGTPVALSVSANAVAVDLSLGNNFTLTLQATTSQQLSNPSNVVAGQSGNIYITQNATPSALTYGTSWIEATTGTAPTVSTTASAQNLIAYTVFDSTHIYYTLMKHGVS